MKKLTILLLTAAIFATLSLRPTLTRVRAQEEGIPVNFQDANLEEVLKLVALISNKRFLYDKGAISTVKLNMISYTNIKADAFYNLFKTIMRHHGFALIPQGVDDDTHAEVIRILQINKMRGEGFALPKEGEAISDEDTITTLVVQLKYANAQEVNRAILPLLSQQTGSGANVISNINSIVITDFGTILVKVQDMIRMMDKPGAVPETETVPIYFSDAEYMQNLLKTYLTALDAAGGVTGQPGGGGQPGPGGRSSTGNEIIADKRTNKLILIGSREFINAATKLVKELDEEPEAASSGLYFVRLKHTNSADVAETLQAIWSEVDTRNQQAAQAGGGAAASPKPRGPRAEGAPGIVADEATNSLIIAASKQQFEELKYLLEQIDVFRPQVLVEAAIIEVSVDEFQKIGLELATADQPHEGSTRFFGATNFNLSTLEVDVDANTIGKTPILDERGGLIAGITKGTVDNIPVLLHALETQGKISVLDRPSVVAVENEAAFISVGDDVPVSSVNNNNNTTSTVTFDQFVSAQIAIRFTPHIVHGRYVRLNIEQLLVEAFSAPPSGNLPPPKRKREITAVVTVPNKHTLIIGGFETDSVTDSTTKIPVLGDVPVLGRVFRTPTHNKTRKSIFVFITPHIMDDPEFKKALDITEQDFDRLKALGMEDQLKLIQDYYGQQKLLQYQPKKLEMIDYKSPEESEGR